MVLPCSRFPCEAVKATKENAMSKELETTLTVEGMGCPSCVSHIDETLSELEGVQRVNVKLREGRVVVRHEAEKTSAAALIAALREAGYESAPSAGS
jgi:copper chaperone